LKKMWNYVLPGILISFSVLYIRCGSKAGETDIDRRSYMLGGIGAFAEVVDIGIKKLALSSPMSPAEMDALIDEARRIAADNNVEIYREENLLITDLFPKELTEGKHVLLIYKGTVKDEYMELKERKKELEESGNYKGEARERLARDFGKLLSYPEKRIDKLLEERRF